MTTNLTVDTSNAAVDKNTFATNPAKNGIPIIDKEPKELPDKDQLILVYCRSGNRSKQASQKLANMGYTNIVEFGGIGEWAGEIE